MATAEESTRDEVAAVPAPAAREAPDPNSPVALWSDFRAALRALMPLRRPAEGAGERLGRAALFYPVVGLLFGLVLVLLDSVLSSVVSQEIDSVFLVAVLVVLSGGRHLDGFANTADGLIGFRGREWALATIRDRRLGTFGVAAICFLFILKVRSFDLLSDQGRLVGLLCPPLLGRWAMVVLAHGSKEAGPPGEGKKFDRGLTFREFSIASVLVFLVLFGLAEAVGLLVLIVVAGMTLGLRVYLHHRLGGITDENVAGIAEAAETVAVMVVALAT